jgi:hypothetical protein
MNRAPLTVVLWLVPLLVVLAALMPSRATAAGNGPAPTSASAAASTVAAPAASSAPAAPAGHGGKSFTDAVPCSACHTTTTWRQLGTSGDSGGFDHATTGFPLTGQHVHTPCASCHSGTTPLKRACASCHEDAHRGRLLLTCDGCHTPAGWKVTRPLELHRMTRFPLTGMHVLADCTECHQRASEQRWTDAPVECFACHEAQYRNPSNFPVHVGTATTPPLPRDCSLCHQALSWVPAKIPTSLSGGLGSLVRPAPASHAIRFPLTGVHRAASCDDCHASVAVPRATRCIGCHAHDPVLVTRQHRQTVAMDGPSCLTCHPGGARR